MEMANSSLEQVVGVVRREAFVGLLRGARVTVTHIVGERGLPRDRARAALDQLVAAGAAEVAGDDEILGAHGLTARTTRHAIALDERVLHTWCALDAVGIPVALGLDATAITTCPTCGARLTVPVRTGRAIPLPFVLWFPTGPCPHLTRDFCSSANLFCHAAHVESWRRQAGNPQGRVVSLPEVEDIARRAWADVVDEGRTVLAVDTAHHTKA
ncbi:MAG TPA: organomercurial lyase [Acidimicrobiia bacterium]|jgi:alkylmercury lyase